MTGTAAKARINWRRAAARAALIVLPLLLLLPSTFDWARSDALTRLENYLYDLRVRLTMPGGVDRRIVIVDIDESSLAREGQWPWTRTKLAASDGCAVRSLRRARRRLRRAVPGAGARLRARPAR